jgi:Flp pilus assembly secretin CpaC
MPNPVVYQAPPQVFANRAQTQQSTLFHLESAIRHLRAADLNREADQLSQKLAAARISHHKILDEKRHELTRLQTEITHLEKLLGVNEQYMISVVVGELKPAQLRAVGIDFSFFGNAFNQVIRQTAAGRGNPPYNKVVETTEFNVLLDALQNGKLVNIQSRPKVVTLADEPASLQCGREFSFPVTNPVPGTPAEMHKRYGFKVDMLVHPVGQDRVQLTIVPERVIRNFKRAIFTEDGVLVPGLTVQRIRQQVEIELGKTSIIAMNSKNEAGEEVIWFVASTPEAVRPLVPEQTELSPKFPIMR